VAGADVLAAVLAPAEVWVPLQAAISVTTMVKHSKTAMILFSFFIFFSFSFSFIITP
jgi:hypothetical protein